MATTAHMPLKITIESDAGLFVNSGTSNAGTTMMQATIFGKVFRQSI
jgi:hypothetical protein